MIRARTMELRSAVAAAIAALTLVVAAVVPIRAQAQSLPATGTIAVPTYESAGLYWQSPGGTAGCEVKFRKSGTSSWSQGLPMWYDARDSQCRGSLVHLTPNTQYEVELNLPGQAASRSLTFKTWANTVPVAKTIQVNGGSATFNVAEGGSPSGYVVYDGKGATLDGGNSSTYNVTINASYVVLRGLNLRGARQDAIRISPNVTDVIIEDNDISGWGRQRSGNFGVDMDSAIRAVCTSPTLQRVTIQRNRISNPRYSANSWSDGHPAGPQAIAFAHCGGNHVFRHNEIFSTNGNYFNDILGGEDNFTKNGFPNADTDIYGNKLSHAWDDAIEAEGANENVRIWGNYIDRTAIGIATTATSVGPVYIFRNVWNRSQMYAKVSSLDQDDRQPFFKSGGTTELGHGRRYIFHNTMLQAQQSGLQYGLGGGFGLGGTGSTQLIENTWSRNNIYHQWKDGKGFTYQTGSTSSFVSDMYNGTPGDAAVTNGIAAKPVYAPGHGWQSESGGNYQLASGSAGVGRATRIANFNDAYAAPDVGAHQSGTAAMVFGIAGSPGSAVGAPVTAPAPPPAVSLVDHFYASILRRAPDPSGAAYWNGEVTRLASLGVNASEVWYAMAAAFFASPEYAAFRRDNVGFVTDLYMAFMSRAPDASGLAHWTAQLAQGMSREVVLASFMFSNEFAALSGGGKSSRIEIDTVLDFYRGLLARLPDANGFNHWLGQFRAAQCQGAGQVYGVMESISAAFINTPEFANRQRTNAQFVGDLYNAFLRRGGDLQGFSFWVGQLNSGARTRHQVRQAFISTPEVAARVNALVAQGCLR